MFDYVRQKKNNRYNRKSNKSMLFNILDNNPSDFLPLMLVDKEMGILFLFFLLGLEKDHNRIKTSIFFKEYCLVGSVL